MADFVRAARSVGESPVTCERLARCGLFLVGEAAAQWGSELPCLAVSQDALGNWRALIRTRGIPVTTQFLTGKEVL